MAEAAPSEAAPAAAPPSDAELDTGPGFKLESHWAIVHKMDTWYPDVVTRSGDNFIKLSKFDRHFVKFCLQKPMDLSKGVGRSANSTLFDKLLELRKRASEESARQQMEMPESGGDTASAVPKRKAKRVRVEDGCLVDPRVTIQLPDLETKTEYFMSRPAKALWGVTSKELWLELNEPNLHYMKALVQHGAGHQQPRKKKEKKGSPKKSPRKRLKRIGHIGGSSPAKMTAAKSKAKSKPDDQINDADTFPDTIPYGNEANEVNSTDLDESQLEAVPPDRQRFDDEHSEG